MKKIIIIVLTLALLISLTSCKSETSTVVDQVKDSEVDLSQIFNIGDTVKVGDLEVTLNSIQETNGDEFAKPDEGNIYYSIDLTLNNVGSKLYESNTIMQMSLIDNQGNSQEQVLLTGPKGSLNEKIEPGKKINGEIVFEISKNLTGLIFTYDYGFVDGQVMFKLDR